MESVLVTPRSLTSAGHPSLDRLSDAGYRVVFCTPGKTPTEDELLALLPSCVGYLAGVEPIPARVLAASPRLRAISRNGVGIDSIDMRAAREAGVRVCTAVGANSQGVAELAVAFVCALARGIPHADATLKAGGWERSLGFELAGRTLGLIGYGNVGRRVARIASCIGMSVIAHDPFAADSIRSDNYESLTVARVFGRADVVSLHAPPSERPLVDSGLLRDARPGLRLVNTARAELVDEEALLAALDDGVVAAYATDVHRQEPPVDRRLVDHPSVIATAHIGGYTRESVDRATDAAVDNLIAALRGDASTDGEVR